MADTQNPLPYLRLQILQRPELLREEARLNGTFTKIDNRIAEREVLFLRSANGVFLAGIADADGDVLMVMKGDLLDSQVAVSIPITREHVRSLYRLMQYGMIIEAPKKIRDLAKKLDYSIFPD